MEVDYALLRTIHQTLGQLNDLNERLEKGPRQIKIAEKAETAFVNDLENVKQNRLRSKMAADEKQLQLSEREARIEDLKLKRNAAGSNREYQLLTDQIAADQQANAVLSDEILELLEKIDNLDADVVQCEANLVKARQETERVQERIDSEMASLETERSQVEKELVENENNLPAEIRIEYKRVVDKRGEETFSETDLTTCGRCFTMITPQTQSELLMKQPVLCKSCGSIMYLKEGTALPN